MGGRGKKKVKWHKPSLHTSWQNRLKLQNYRSSASTKKISYTKSQVLCLRTEYRTSLKQLILHHKIHSGQVTSSLQTHNMHHNPWPNTFWHCKVVYSQVQWWCTGISQLWPFLYHLISILVFCRSYQALESGTKGLIMHTNLKNVNSSLYDSACMEFDAVVYKLEHNTCVVGQ